MLTGLSTSTPPSPLPIILTPLGKPHDPPTTAQQANKQKREVVFKRAEQYVNEYRKKEREEIRLRRVAKASGDFYVPAQPKVYFVIRLKG